MKCSLLLAIFLLSNTLAAFSQVPTHLWSNNIANSIDKSEVVATAVNAQGDVYVAGRIATSADFDPSSNIVNVSASNPLGELYIAKYDKDGNYVWAYPFGQGNVSISDIKLDSNGNICLAGFFTTTVDFDIYPFSNYVLSAGGIGSGETYIAKYDSNGSLLWVERVENVSPTAGNGIFFYDVNSNDDILVSGTFSETVSFGLSNFQMTSNINTSDTFIAKYDTDGNFIWAKQLGSPSTPSPFCYEIASDQNLDVYLVFLFRNPIDFDPSATSFILTPTLSPSVNYALVKYDSNGNFVWANLIDAMSNVTFGAIRNLSISFRSPNKLNFVGSTQGIFDFDPSAATSVFSSPSNLNTFFAKYDINGNFISMQQLTSPRNIIGKSTTDAAGNLYFPFSYQGTVDIDLSPTGTVNLTAVSLPFPNYSDLSMVSFDKDFNYLWHGEVFPQNDGVSYVSGSDLELDTKGNFYMAGNVRGTADFDMLAGVANVSSLGTAQPNAFLAKYGIPECSLNLKSDTVACGSSLMLTAPSGFTSYTWTFPNGTTSTNPTISANQVGTYYLDIVSRCGSARDSIEVDFRPAATLDLGTDKQICAGSSVVLNAPSGFTSYLWTLPNATTSNVQNLTATEAGTYSLRVTNSCGTATDNIDVIISPLPTVDLGIDKQICAGSSVVLNAPNGFTSYLWTLPNATTSNVQNLTATEAGTYSLQVTNSCGTATDNIDITILPLPTVDLGTDKQICAGTSTVLNAPSGFTSYLWTLPNSTTSNSQNLTATEAGTYSLSVTNSCGTATDNIDITILPLPTVDLGTDKQICAGTSTVLNAPSGFTSYLWTLPNSTTSNSQNLTATEAGTYSLQVTNSCGTATDDINVTISPLPTVDLGTDKQICAGSSVVLNAPSGFTSYTWFLPNNSVSNLQTITVSETGIYKLTVTNSCGAATDEIKVQVLPNPSLNLGNDVFTCQNDTTLSAPLGFGSYLWTFPNGITATNQTITANQEGNYILKVENNCGIVRDTITVSFHQKPNIDLGIDTLLCQNESVTISLPVDYNYLWFDADTSKTRSFSSAGIYYFDILNECGTKRDSIIINNYVEPTINLGEDRLLCEGETVILSVNNPTNFPVLWNTGQTTNSIEINKKGTYSVQVFSECEIYSDSVQINYKNKPNLTPIKDAILCNNENYFVEIDSTNPDVSISWFDGNTDFSRILNGASEYSYTLTNECGSVSDTFSIVLPNNEDIKIDLGNDKMLCNGESTLLSAANETGNFSYLWNTGSTESQISVNTAGIYFVTVSNSCSSKSDTIKIEYVEEINTKINLTQKDCGEAILNVDLKEGETIKWNDGSRESEFIPLKSGIYEAEVSNDCETKIYSIEVEIIDFTKEFPNVITPNDDGFNDAYVLPFEGAQIFVYDRWEKLIYQNDNYKNDWSPKNLTGGTYYLLIKHPCLDGNKKIVLSILK